MFLLRWIKDPRLARRLARATWPILIVGYFMIWRSRLAEPQEVLATLALVLLVFVLNVPVLYGLRASRDLAHTKAFKAVAIALSLRAAATAAVVVMLSG